MAATGANSIRLAAMDFLARREHSLYELGQKLSRRFPDEGELISLTLGRLRDEGLQSDDRMAEAFLRARVNRGQGPIRISAELKLRGLPEQTISQAFEQAGIDWFELVMTVCERKFGTVKPRDLKEKAKRARFLQQRGFTFDQINALFD